MYSGISTSSKGANPDRINGNYHIDSSTSPAIDRCKELPNQNKDFNYENRRWDDPSVINNGNDFLFTYDVGVYKSDDNDIIFKNEFDL